MNHRTRWMSPREKWAARLALLAGLGFVAACATGPERPTPALYAGYERSPAFDEAIQTHVDAGTDREQRLLLTTWFQDGDPRVAQFCSVRPDGRCSTYQYVHQTEFRAPSTASSRRTCWRRSRRRSPSCRSARSRRWRTC
jgi:hypothetical protein